MPTFIKKTDFFKLYSLTDGVYAAIAIPGKGAWSNAGIVDLGDEVLIFDSFSTPSAGQELRKQAELLTGKKVKHLINSHYHGDHVFGNQAFRDASIISTVETKELSKEKNKLGDVEKEIEDTKEYLQNVKQQIKLTRDPILKASLENQYNEMNKVLNDIPLLEMVLPSVLFEEKLLLKGSKRKVELHCLGGGHTPSDTFMYLPEDKIAFMGDLLTENLHVPIIEPEDFLHILERVRELNIFTYVPGHGKVGNKELLNELEGYVTFLKDTVTDAINKHVPLESLVTRFEAPLPYKNWMGVGGIEGNLSKMYEFYRGKKQLRSGRTLI
ncbi:MBL fold metallo-hydrolase [Rossellomorea oryzaecorticis]|uniref:MBL fold metallo-hydrolase n=1 Tax=Rossellomorea oryzaecorticis TaxID=1396505 RepID=A0ABW8VIC5_9BACI